MNNSAEDSHEAGDTASMRLPLRIPRLDSLEDLYGHDAAAAQKTRYEGLAKGYGSHFSSGSDAAQLLFFSAPGRTELCGNHTDHNHGNVLAAAISLDTAAAAAPRRDARVRVVSEGFPAFELDLADLSVHVEERGSSAAIVRGMAAGIADYAKSAARRGAAPSPLRGFDAFVQSEVLSGSGLSSSAAFELLVGGIIATFSGIEISPMEIASIGQYSENVYFGKPCGLMDQMACALGNIALIDFGDPLKANVELLRFAPSDYGLSLVIVSTGGSHADLTEDYAAIPAEMKSVAAFLSKTDLSRLTSGQLIDSVADIRRACGDRAFLRAWHFVKETARPAALAAAIRQNDIVSYLATIRASGDSSARFLQNLSPANKPSAQGLMVAIALTENFLGGEGACRVHGGGFAGTIQAYIPTSRLSDYVNLMESVFGPGTVFPLRIRPYGVVCIEIH
ncbi:MAG: galactokinase family protein [Spirochaetales bacterium]